jgi:hypothetical protein
MPLLDPWHPDVPASAVGMHPFSTLCRGLERSMYVCNLSICWFAALGQNGVHFLAVDRSFLRRVCGMLGPEVDEGVPHLSTLFGREQMGLSVLRLVALQYFSIPPQDCLSSIAAFRYTVYAVTTAFIDFWKSFPSLLQKRHVTTIPGYNFPHFRTGIPGHSSTSSTDCVRMHVAVLESHAQVTMCCRYAVAGLPSIFSLLITAKS